MNKRLEVSIIVPLPCKPPYYPVVWVKMPLKIGKRKFWVYVGVCGFTRKPFSVQSGSSGVMCALMIKDLIVENDECEEARNCMNFGCSLNKTTFESWVQRKIPSTPRRLRNLKRNFEFLAKIIADMGVDKIFHELQVEN